LVRAIKVRRNRAETVGYPEREAGMLLRQLIAAVVVQ